MTVTACRQLCLGQNAQMALLQGDQCHCDVMAVNTTAFRVEDKVAHSECVTPCPGDAMQKCGGNQLWGVFSVKVNISK